MRIRLYGGPENGKVYDVEDHCHGLDLARHQPVKLTRCFSAQLVCQPFETIRVKIERYGITYGRIAYRELKFGVAERHELTECDKYQIREDLGKTPIQYTELSILNDFDAWFDQICHKITGFTYRTHDPFRMV